MIWQLVYLDVLDEVTEAGRRLVWTDEEMEALEAEVLLDLENCECEAYWAGEVPGWMGGPHCVTESVAQDQTQYDPLIHPPAHIVHHKLAHFGRPGGHAGGLPLHTARHLGPVLGLGLQLLDGLSSIP